MNDPIKTLEGILKQNGQDVNLRENEVDRYFLFDQISEPADLDLAWAQFPAHREIRACAAEVDAVSDVVAGWGYRIPKKSNRSSDSELSALVREHTAAIRSLISGWTEAQLFIDGGFDIQVVGSEVGAPPDPTQNMLFMALYELMGDFRIDHYSYEQPILDVLKDWAIYLTKCDEIALYLVWPILKDVDAIDPRTPVSGFRLWQYDCRTNYWIKDGDMKSRVVYVQRLWAR